MHIYAGILSLIWVVFIVYWIISAFSSKRNAKLSPNTRLLFILVRIVILIIVLIIFDAQIFSSTPAPLFIPPVNPALNVIGLIFAAAGVVFAIWARVYLGKNWGMPMSVKVNPELVTDGPYAIVRHPIYTGVLFAMLGSVGVQGLAWLIAFVGGTLYFIYAATREEKLMQSQFPDAYPAYKKRTKMLIPFIF